MINNLSLILPLLEFNQADDFYMLYIFQRKKDQANPEKYTSVKVIKSYCLNSIDYLEEKMPEIIDLCELFQARAYIHVRVQNHHEVGLYMIEEITKRLRNKQYNQQRIFDKVVGQLKASIKRWIIDVDRKEQSYLDELTELINKCQPEGDKIITYIPTKQGWHIISKPFNLKDFNDRYTGEPIDIQKNNPTLLYYPNSLN